MNSEKINKKLISQSIQQRGFVFLKPSISDLSIKILILLGLQILMLALTKSYASLVIVIVSLCGGLAAAALNYLITKEPVYQTMNIVIQGIIIGMLLPQTFPPLAVFFISFFILTVSRSLFFKDLNNWVNIVPVAIIICWMIGRRFFPDFLVTQNLLTLKNPSLYLIQNGDFPVYEYDSSIINFLNSTVFKLFKVTVPEGFISLLWDTHSVIPAFRFNLLTILASVILFAQDSFYGIVPGFMLFIYALLVRLFAPVFFGGDFNTGDIILALLTSGTLFCATFVINWFGTTPVSVAGKIVYGCICGVVMFFVVGSGTSPVGMVYTVLICNIISVMLRTSEEHKNNAIMAKYNSKDENAAVSKVEQKPGQVNADQSAESISIKAEDNSTAAEKENEE